jgi:hypothetical protein
MRNDHLDETNGPRHDPRDREIDDALMQALRAEDPGAAFTQRVLARAREERAAQQSGRPLHAVAIDQTAATVATAASPATASTSASAEAEVEAGVSAPPSGRRTQRFTATRKLIAAIAASLTLAAVGEQWLQHRRYVAEGERARAQVLAALRLTNQKLNIVHDQITGREHAR